MISVELLHPVVLCGCVTDSSSLVPSIIRRTSLKVAFLIRIGFSWARPGWGAALWFNCVTIIILLLGFLIGA